jgi:vacuolar-type H+-ATPase subunit I/STV1
MINTVVTFIKNNIKSILIFGLIIFCLYWLIFVLTPKAGLSTEQKQLLDSLNTKVEVLHNDNLKLEQEVNEYNQKISDIDVSIDKIKGQKTLIKEIYHEKISSVDKLTIAELDSFFANRYKY